MAEQLPDLIGYLELSESGGATVSRRRLISSDTHVAYIASRVWLCIMTALFSFLKRAYTIFSPPAAPKVEGALRFGILGAANIAPLALISAAKSHPEVIVAAVAARDKKKAEVYAKKHDIPIVHDSYENLIDDPTITCIYIPLPNGLHYPWAVRALQAGKHVLLEKPSVSNATEAASLFRHPVLSQSNAPVLLEAVHYRFHPAWQYFLTLFDKNSIEEVEVEFYLLAGVFPTDDIRFQYDLAGGTLMDMGTYDLSVIRQVFGCEPESVTSATYRPMPKGGDERADQAMVAKYLFPNGGTAKITADLAARGGYWMPSVTGNWPRLSGALPKLKMKLREQDAGEENGHKKRVQQSFVFYNFVMPSLYHRIDIITTTSLYSSDGKLVRATTNTEYKKAYTSPGGGGKGEEWWTTYRHQLEAFVNRVKGREGNDVWVDGEDSIKQMELIDRTYEASGLPIRPTCRDLL